MKIFTLNAIARLQKQCAYPDEKMFGDFTNLVQNGPRPRGYWLWSPVAAHIDCSITAIWDVLQDIVNGDIPGVQVALEEAKIYLLNFGLIGEAIADSTTYRISGAAGLRGVYKKLSEDVPQGLVVEFEFPKKPYIKGIAKYLLESLEYESKLANRNRLCITRYIEWCKFKALGIKTNQTMSKQPDVLFAEAVYQLVTYDKRYKTSKRNKLEWCNWSARHIAEEILTERGWSVKQVFNEENCTFMDNTPGMKFGEYYLQITRSIPEYLGILAKPCSVCCKQLY